jgi:hypothetical protein
VTGRWSAGGCLLQFVNGAVVVAFAGQPGRHSPGGGAVAGVFGDPADGRPQRAGGGVLAQPDAGTGVDDPAGVVGLVAAGTTISGTPAIRAFITVP